MKIAFMFSGQGAQYCGMGKGLYDKFEIVKDTFDQADNALGIKISDICFRDDTTLNKTEFTQPAILTLSVACSRLLEKEHIHSEFNLGLSLGEYSALVASNVISFEEAVCLVRKRGRFMTEAVAEGKGTMYAILGLSRELIDEACKEASSEGMVFPANYNAPGQIVIAGETKACELAAEIATKKGAMKAIRLNVSGPFHTIMLQDASQKLCDELKKMSINNFTTPIIANASASILNDTTKVIDNLTKQIISPVYWEDSMNKLISLGIDTFVELGPGKTLCSFAKKINRKIKVYNIEDVESYEKTINALKEEQIC